MCEHWKLSCVWIYRCFSQMLCAVDSSAAVVVTIIYTIYWWQRYSKWIKGILKICAKKRSGTAAHLTTDLCSFIRNQEYQKGLAAYIFSHWILRLQIDFGAIVDAAFTATQTKSNMKMRLWHLIAKIRFIFGILWISHTWTKMSFNSSSRLYRLRDRERGKKSMPSHEAIASKWKKNPSE